MKTQSSYFSIHGVTACIYLDKRIASQNNTYPIKYRVTFNRKHQYFVTGTHVTQKQWETFFKSNKKTIKNSRELIYVGFERLKNVITDIYLKNLPFSFELLKLQYSTHSKYPLKTLFNEYISQIKDNDIIKSNNFEITLNILEEFNNNKSADLSDVTIDFLKTFKLFLLNKKNCSFPECKKHLENIKFILSIAKKNNYISSLDFPFGKGKFIIQNDNKINNNKITNRNKIAIDNDDLQDQNNEYLYSTIQTVESYRLAFEKHFGCKPTDYSIQIKYKDYPNIKSSPILFLYMGDYYEMRSDYDIEVFVMECLSHIDSANLLPVDAISEVAEDCMRRELFYDSLLYMLEDNQEQHDLSFALSIYNATLNQYLFWSILYKCDSPYLYGKAVLSIINAFEFYVVADEIIELITFGGMGNFNELQDGIFEIINLNEDDEKNFDDYNPCFFLYSVGSEHWS